MKIGDVLTLASLGEQKHKVTAIAEDGRITLETYLWPYEISISESELQKRRAVYEEAN